MTDLNLITSLIAPDIDVSELPPEEADAANIVSQQLTTIAHCVSTFGEALALIDACDNWLSAYEKERRQMKEADSTAYRDWRADTRLEWSNHLAWRHIAFRDGAMTIFHFGKERENTRRYMETAAPGMFRKLDTKQLEESNRLYNLSFPHSLTMSMRNAVAHSFTVEQKQENVAEDGFISDGLDVAPGTSTTLRGVSSGRSYIHSIYGKTVTYNLDQATLDAMKNVVSTFFAAFSPLDARTILLRKMGLDPSDKMSQGKL